MRLRLALLAILACAALGATAGAAPAGARSGGDPWPAPIPWGRTYIAAMAAAAASTGADVWDGSPGTNPGGSAIRLSDEQTLSRWANIAHVSTIYLHPDRHSRPIDRLRAYTEDGFREVYLLLVMRSDRAGHAWVQLRVPGRPNGRIGWVPRGALGAFHVTNHLIVVDRQRLRMYLYEHGQRRWSAPVGVGKPGTPTPAGHFWIRERFKILDRGSGYWPYAFGTADYSTLTEWPGGGVVGIHGPYHEPQRIPGRPSHGCIRLRTSDDAWLAQHVDVGTPLQVM